MSLLGCTFVLIMISKLSSTFTIREATEEDLSELVHIHVTSWNLTYPNFEPKPTYALREAQWARLFDSKNDNWFSYVVQDKEGKIAGFATGHDFKDAALPYSGQLDKIHLLPAYHRKGLGTSLVLQVAQHFLQHRISSMILFSDPENVNIRFYDRLGGLRLLDNDGIFQGAFGWRDLDVLVLRCQELIKERK
jgi:ribosomal protein S18 acetylase RimI-like enzyme